MALPFQVMNHPDLHQTVWAQWSFDDDAYQVYADEECTVWLGDAQSVKGCLDVAKIHFEGLMTD